MIRISAAFIAFLRFSLVLFTGATSLAPMAAAAQQPANLPKPFKVKDVHWHGSPAAHEMIAGIWRVDHTFRSKIRIKNVVENAPLSVTPVLLMADGTEYDLPNVELSPAGVASVDVNESLDGAPDAIRQHLSGFGSVALRYTWYWSGAILGQIENLDVPRSIIYPYPFELHNAGVEKPQKQQIEGMWWKHDPGVGGFVALTNVSGSEIHARVSISERTGRVVGKVAVSLAPRNTRLVDLEDLFAQLPGGSTEGGIYVNYIGSSHDLIAVGGLENVREGYSARLPLTQPEPPIGKAVNVPAGSTGAEASMGMADPKAAGGFVDHTPPSVVTLAAVGIMVGKPDPMMMFPGSTEFTPYATLRNTTKQALALTASVYYMQDGKPESIALPGFVLAANETRQLGLRQLLSDADLGDLKGEINLTFSFAGDWRDLLLATGSVDQSGNYVFEVEPAGLGPTSGQVISYWNVADGTDTMFSIWDHGDSDEDLVVTLFYKDGSYQYPVHLAAKASRTFNVSEIIQEHRPDANGAVIPFFIRQGSAKISGPDADIDIFNATVSVSNFNPRTKTCGVICRQCTGVTSFFVNPSPFAATTGTSMQLAAIGQNNNGNQANYTSRGQWSSNNTSVATVSAGSVQPLAAGQVAVAVSVNGIPINGEACSARGSGPCPSQNFSAQAPGQVGPPKISSISPSMGLVGTGTNVTISGAGFTGATVSAPSGANISVSNVSVNSDTQITATLTPTNSTPGGGNQAITVTANNQSASTSFFGQIPTSLTFISSSTIADGSPGGCTPSTDFGIVIDIKYQVMDQESSPQAIQSNSMTPFEDDTFPGGATGSGDVCANSPVADCTLMTASDGSWHDAPVGACNSQPLSGLTDTQVVSMLVGSAKYKVRTNNFTINSNSSGHGTVTNGNDINVTR